MCCFQPVGLWLTLSAIGIICGVVALPILWIPFKCGVRRGYRMGKQKVQQGLAVGLGASEAALTKMTINSSSSPTTPALPPHGSVFYLAHPSEFALPSPGLPNATVNGSLEAARGPGISAESAEVVAINQVSCCLNFFIQTLARVNS
jgi:hypothetical protein